MPARDPNPSPASPSPKFERWLAILFLLSLPLLNPWVRGDGVGYYAYARALLIRHNLDFEPDYLVSNPAFRDARVDENGRIKPEFRTPTGHLDNHFSIGPAILWSPFLLAAHAAVLIAAAAGSRVPADGFSAPYRLAMALGTAVYGFLGLVLAFRIARQYVEELWAFWATLAVWWASSLPVYMYFNPSWSHAHSAFSVALFLWYWHETRRSRSLRQWSLLGAIAGLMLNVYYVNAMLLVVLLFDPISQYRQARQAPKTAVWRAVGPYVLFAAVALLCLLPTFASRYVVYGSPFETGYVHLEDWNWTSPVLLQILFSSNHGLFVWTPVAALAVIGLFLFGRRSPAVGTPILAAAIAFYLLMACYPDWTGIASFGNRFFVSLTAPFVIGLGVLLSSCAQMFPSPRKARLALGTTLGGLMLWNAGFFFQWGTHLVPPRGPISWPEMAHNQFFVVPGQVSAKLREYLFHRGDVMRQIEQRDSLEKPRDPDE